MKTRLALLAALLAGLLPAPAKAASDSLQLVEQEIKAGLLYNFLKYTDWPVSTAPMVVCLYGGDPFAGKLQPMAGRSVNQRVIEIRAVDAADQAAPCSLLFVNAETRAKWPGLLASLRAKPLLTVSDSPGFSDSGGMIEFTRVNNRIGVKINTDAVAAAQLKVQDRLLKLATPVRGGTGGP